MVVFDMSGNPLRRLDRSGRGPEEYGPYPLDGWVEPESNSVYVRGMTGIYEYDTTTFDFRRSGWPKFTFPLPHSFAPLNRDYAIVHNKYQYGSDGNNGSHDTFFLVSKPDWTLTPLPITLERPYFHDLDGRMEHSAMIPGRGGLFLCNMRCDTIAWIDRSTMKVTPRMVDKTDYTERDQSGHDIMAVPSFETDRYLFFSILFQRLVREDQQMRAFVFDKRLEKIFRLPQPAEEQTATKWSESKFNMQLSLARNECFLTTWSTTLNENYGAELFQAIDLVDNIDRLPPELKKIAATLKEDDNPVLALIKFK
jgi:hypothetical protein